GGTFIYTPASGTTLNAGNGQLLSVTFLPSDSTTYAAASRTVHINVTAARNNAIVRVAYLVPSNRVAQANGIVNLQHAVLYYQSWFLDQMQRNGFGSKTFAAETEADGVTPKVDVLPIPQSDS